MAFNEIGETFKKYKVLYTYTPIKLGMNQKWNSCDGNINFNRDLLYVEYMVLHIQ